MTNTYKVEDLAEYLRLNVYTVRRLAKAGKIPAFKVGNQWRFDARAIDEWQKGDADNSP